MSEPKRIQRKRTKGWKMPEDTVYVGRPSKWGNPFKVGEVVEGELLPYVNTLMKIYNQRPGVLVGVTNIRLLVPQDVVSLYDIWVSQQPHLMLSVDQLRGRDLCCWCPLDSPCHADVLLDLANAEATS